MLPSFTEDKNLANIAIIASDMDCTLLADDGSMPPNMPERICALDKAGITFCAASGRPSYTLFGMFPGLREHMAFLSDNGAAIFCRGKLVFKDLIDVASYQKLLDFTVTDGRGCPTICGLNACYIRSCDKVYDEVFRTFYKKIIYMDDLSALNAEVNKYTVFFPDNDSEEVYIETYKDAWSSQYSVTTSGKMWIDVMNKHVDKGEGLRRLAAYLHVDLKDTCALGDTYNDIQMLETAGHSYLVANAEKHMEAHATWHVPSNNERGVATVIDTILAAQN